LIEVQLGYSSEGAKIAVLAEEKLAEIDAQVDRVSKVLSEVADATRAQLAGVREIDTSIQSLQATTQDVAASAEETSAASQELAGQSERMQEMVAQFTLTTAGTAPLLRRVA
jgi:methyl-accepting chemotaxis protein